MIGPYDNQGPSMLHSTTVLTMQLFDLLYLTVITAQQFLRPCNRQMVGYCMYEMYLFSRTSKALFEQVFSDTDKDNGADIKTQERTQSLSSPSLILSRKSSC